jgi:hypothetical protein
VIAFKTEAELCGLFRDRALASGWRVHSEANGFDIYCVTPTGAHIGIEAKLRLNFKVISQALPWKFAECGPDYHAVLFPTDPGVDDVLECLGLFLYSGEQLQKAYRHDRLQAPPETRCWWPLRHPPEPEFETDSVAGSPCPTLLTPWKTKALELMARLEVRGYVTRTDFMDCGIDHRLWTNCRNGWLVKRGEDGQYIRGDKLKFDVDHPTAYAAILKRVREKLEATDA